MHEALEPRQDPGWVLSHEGYNVLTESAVESRLAFGNGFLGMRAARSVSRGPTWVGWLGYMWQAKAIMSTRPNFIFPAFRAPVFQVAHSVSKMDRPKMCPHAS